MAEREKEKRGQLGKGCLISMIYVTFVVSISILFAVLIVSAANDMFSFRKNYAESTVTVEEGTKINDIASQLKEADIINNKFLFKLMAMLLGKNKDFAVGTYNVTSEMDYQQLFGTVQRKASRKEEVSIVIPEGFDMKQVFKRLEEKGVCGYDEMMLAAKESDFEYSFLKDKEKTQNRLEGYLFPDTYIFYMGDDPNRVINKFLTNFSRKFNSDFKQRLVNMNMTMEKAIIIASMIEKEAMIDDDRDVIASVIYNRLESKNFPNLQIDATVQYALPEHKEQLSNEDLNIDSPYNTYKIKGLPPGPICNPGVDSIYAALNPRDTNYYYYVARPDGSHYFARNNTEHNANAAKAKREFAEAEKKQ